MHNQSFYSNMYHAITYMICADRNDQVEIIIPANQTPHSPHLFAYPIAKATSAMQG